MALSNLDMTYLGNDFMWFLIHMFMQMQYIKCFILAQVKIGLHNVLCMYIMDNKCITVPHMYQICYCRIAVLYKIFVMQSYIRFTTLLTYVLVCLQSPYSRLQHIELSKDHVTTRVVLHYANLAPAS